MLKSLLLMIAGILPNSMATGDLEGGLCSCADADPPIMGPPPSGNCENPESEGDIMECACLKCMNDARAAGLSCPDGNVFEPTDNFLELHTGLSEVAQAWSVKQAQTGYGHGPFVETIKGISLIPRSENVAKGSRGSPMKNGEGVCKKWLESDKGHCSSIMDPQTKLVGCRHADIDDGTHFWTAMFANPP